MATRVLPPRAVKKRPLESSSDVEVVPKPTRTPANKKTAAKKGTAKRGVKGKGKAVETEKPKETEKQPNKGKGKQKAEVEVNAVDEEPAAPQAKRRKTTKTVPASKTGTTTRTAKRSSPGEYFFHLVTRA